jgi:hypothetical protein
MQASELRIGNYYNEFGNFRKVSWNTIKELETPSSTDQYWCKKIPITEEWLLKFGFKKHLDTIYQHWSNQTGIFQISTRLPKGSYGIWCGSGTMGCFEYVHQLQNIFFALTGEELTIKEEKK